MKINIINRLDLDCLDVAIGKAQPFDYLVMNSQTRLAVSCNSHGLCISYVTGKNKSYSKYKHILILIDESLQDGEVKFVKEI